VRLAPHADQWGQLYARRLAAAGGSVSFMRRLSRTAGGTDLRYSKIISCVTSDCGLCPPLIAQQHGVPPGPLRLSATAGPFTLAARSRMPVAASCISSWSSGRLFDRMRLKVRHPHAEDRCRGLANARPYANASMRSWPDLLPSEARPSCSMRRRRTMLISNDHSSPATRPL
jgi:hypothetical protein